MVQCIDTLLQLIDLSLLLHLELVELFQKVMVVIGCEICGWRPVLQSWGGIVHRREIKSDYFREYLTFDANVMR